MDPTATLQAVREYIKEGEELAAAEAFVELDQWLSKGGFLPEQWTPPRGRPRRTEDGPRVLDDVPHGRRRSYNLGCQCVPCTAANRLRRNLTPAEMEEYTHGQ